MSVCAVQKYVTSCNGTVVPCFWKVLSLPPPMPQHPYYVFWSGHFAVTKESVRNRSKSFWEAWYNYSMDFLGTYKARFGDAKERGFALEALWYTLFQI